MSGLEADKIQPVDGCKMFGIGCDQRQVVFQCGGGDQGVGHLQAVRQRERFHQVNGALRDRFGDGQAYGVAHGQTFLHGLQFGAVAHALQQFQPGHGRQGEGVECIEYLRCLGQAAQVPDQHIGIDQHIQDSLREPSRL